MARSRESAHTQGTLVEKLNVLEGTCILTHEDVLGTLLASVLQFYRLDFRFFHGVLCAKGVCPDGPHLQSRAGEGECRV